MRVVWLPLVLVCLLALPAWAQRVPLDVGNPSARRVFVEVESSPDEAVVGQSFDPPWPATWSVTGNVGRVEVSIPDHEDLREEFYNGFYTAIPDTFATWVIEIDLGTLEATTQQTTGDLQNLPLQFRFTLLALDTARVGGFIGPDTPPLFCTSQQQVDDACMIDPIFCGQVCNIVPGSPYDPGTGMLHLIGAETQIGCDGASCFGPFDYFARAGDLRLTEFVSASVPAAASPLRALLALLLFGTALAALRMRRGRGL